MTHPPVTLDRYQLVWYDHGGMRTSQDGVEILQVEILADRADP